MRTYRLQNSTLPERYFYTQEEIEKEITRELRKADCLPKEPGEIDIDEYLLVAYDGLTACSSPLPLHILGQADLSKPKSPEIYIAQHVMDGPDYRYQSTLAHEAAHLIFHAHLFLDEAFLSTMRRYREADASNHTISCLSRDVLDSPRKNYNPHEPFAHIEHQANLGMVAFRLPKILVRKAVDVWVTNRTRRDGTREEVFDETKRPEAVKTIVEIFNVSRQMARYRLEELYPSAEIIPRASASLSFLFASTNPLSLE